MRQAPRITSPRWGAYRRAGIHRRRVGHIALGRHRDGLADFALHAGRGLRRHHCGLRRGRHLGCRSVQRDHFRLYLRDVSTLAHIHQVEGALLGARAALDGEVRQIQLDRHPQAHVGAGVTAPAHVAVIADQRKAGTFHILDACRPVGHHAGAILVQTAGLESIRRTLSVTGRLIIPLVSGEAVLRVQVLLHGQDEQLALAGNIHQRVTGGAVAQEGIQWCSSRCRGHSPHSWGCGGSHPCRSSSDRSRR